MSVEQQLGATKDSNTIFVYNLPQNVTEPRLYEILTSNSNLQVASLQVLKKNPIKPYAYVNFATPEQALEALKSANFLKYDDNEVVLSKCVKPNTLSPESNLYVTGFDALPESEFTYRNLFNAFSQFGSVISIRIRDQSPKSACYIQYESLEHAQAALTSITQNGLQVGATKVNPRIEVFKSRLNRQRNFTNVFIRNFPANYPLDQFKALCQQYGPVDSVWFPPAFPNKPGSDEPSQTGYGFANFSNHIDAQNAIEGLNKETVGDFRLEAFEARDRASRARDVQERSKQYQAQTGGSTRPNYANRAPRQLRNGVQTRLATQVRCYPPPEAADMQSIANMVKNTTNIHISPRGYVSVSFTDSEAANAGRLAFPKEWAAEFCYFTPRRHTFRRHHYNRYPHPQYYNMMPNHYMPYPHGMPPQQMQHQQQNRMQSRRFRERRQGGPMNGVPMGQQQPQQQQQSNAPQGALSPDERQQKGAALYYKIQPHFQGDDETTSKITGMLLELPLADIDAILSNEHLLTERIHDARVLLQPQGQ